MSKGQLSIPFTLIESVTTFIIIIGIVNGVAIRSGDFLARETVDLEIQRINNAALALNSVPEGYVEVGVEAQDTYEFKYNNGNLSLNYSNVVRSQEFPAEEAGYDEVKAPSSFTEIEDRFLCIRKSQEGDQEILEFEVGGC